MQRHNSIAFQIGTRLITLAKFLNGWAMHPGIAAKPSGLSGRLGVTIACLHIYDCVKPHVDKDRLR